MQHLNRYLMLAGLTAMLSGVGIPFALADCYEGIGCSDSDEYDVDDLVELSCENLWHVRNRIYDENGFCFKTKRAREAFDNSDCWVKNASKVKLSQIERRNVDAIVEAEEANGCR